MIKNSKIYLLLRSLLNLMPLNPSFTESGFTSYVVSTAVWAWTSVVFFMIDSGEFGSLYAALVPPEEVTTGIFALKDGVAGKVDILSDA